MPEIELPASLDVEGDWAATVFVGDMDGGNEYEITGRSGGALADALFGDECLCGPQGDYYHEGHYEVSQLSFGGVSVGQIVNQSFAVVRAALLEMTDFSDPVAMEKSIRDFQSASGARGKVEALMADLSKRFVERNDALHEEKKKRR